MFSCPSRIALRGKTTARCAR